MSLWRPPLSPLDLSVETSADRVVISASGGDTWATIDLDWEAARQLRDAIDEGDEGPSARVAIERWANRAALYMTMGRLWKRLAKRQRRAIAEQRTLLEAHDLEAAHQALDWLRVPRRFPAADIGEEPGTLTQRVLGLVALTKGYILTADRLERELAKAHHALDEAGIEREAPVSMDPDCDETEPLSLASRIRNLMVDRDEAAGDLKGAQEAIRWLCVADNQEPTKAVEMAIRNASALTEEP